MIVKRESVEKVRKLKIKCGNLTDMRRDKCMKTNFTSIVNEAIMNVTLLATLNEGLGGETGIDQCICIRSVLE